MIGSLVVYAVCLATSIGGYVVTARGKPVSSSSRYHHSNGPEKAVDGDTDSIHPNIFHSALYTSSSWWRVDLGEEIISPRVTIYFRTPSTGRRNGVQISLVPMEGDTTDFCEVVTGAADGSNIPAVYEFTCDTRGRYLTLSTVTISDEYGAVLNFGEVEVYACSQYTFGPTCSSACHCAEDPCDWRLESPVCAAGCTPGWKSSACDKLLSANDVSAYMKHLDICDVPVSITLETVALMSVLQMESLDLEYRMECFHKCLALVLCVSFEYETTTCTLYRAGSSGLSGSRDMWKK